MRAKLEESPPLLYLPAQAAVLLGYQTSPVAMGMQLSAGLSYWGALIWASGRFYRAVGTMLGGRHSSAACSLMVLPICIAGSHHSH